MTCNEPYTDKPRSKECNGKMGLNGEGENDIEVYDSNYYIVNEVQGKYELWFQFFMFQSCTHIDWCGWDVVKGRHKRWWWDFCFLLFSVSTCLKLDYIYIWDVENYVK